MPHIKAQGLPQGMRGRFNRIRNRIKEAIAGPLGKEPEDVGIWLREFRHDEDEHGITLVELLYLDTKERTPEVIREIGEIVVAILDEEIESVARNEGHQEIRRIVFTGTPRNPDTFVRRLREW